MKMKKNEMTEWNTWEPSLHTPVRTWTNPPRQAKEWESWHVSKKRAPKWNKKLTKFPYESIRRVIKKKMNENYVRYVKMNGNLEKLLENSNLIPEQPHKTAVAMFRLITRHDCSSKHLHRIGIMPSPHCPLSRTNQIQSSLYRCRGLFLTWQRSLFVFVLV